MQGTLRCFKRIGLESIFGCVGGGPGDIFGDDYCADRDAYPNELFYAGKNSQPGSLGMCDGDCDPTLGECQAGLYCYERDGTEPIPGCVGEGRTGADYCTLDLTSSTESPTKSPTDVPTEEPTAVTGSPT